MTETSTPKPWFRMYHEFATDPKVQMLSEVDQRRFIMLLCLRCRNGIETLHDEEVAFQLRISNGDWVSTKEVLVSKELVSIDNSIPAWDKRQFSSDSSTARVQKHRENQVSKRNVSETPPYTDTDTDTELKKQTKKTKTDTSLFDTFWDRYPRKTNKVKARVAFDKLSKPEDLINQILKNIDDRLAVGDWSIHDKEHIPHASTYLNGERWEDEVIKPSMKSFGGSHATGSFDHEGTAWLTRNSGTDQPGIQEAHPALHGLEAGS